MTKPSTDTALKSFNSLNVKSTNNYKTGLTSTTTVPPSNTNNINNMNSDSLSKNRQATHLVHRHSNPVSSYNNNQPNSNMQSTSKNKSIQQNQNSLTENTPNTLPRIRINT